MPLPHTDIGNDQRSGSVRYNDQMRLRNLRGRL